MKALLVACLLAGCVPPEVEATGPKIDITIEPVAIGPTIHDTDLMPDMDIDTDSMTYKFTLSIDCDFGKRMTTASNSTTSTDTPCTSMTATLSVPGFTLPASTFDTSDTTRTRTFKAHDPLAVPATFKGQSMSVTAQGTGSDGLKSNLVDFMVLLN